MPDVVAEVEVRDGPLLFFPAPVERRRVDLRVKVAVHLYLDLVHRHPQQVFERRLLDLANDLRQCLLAHCRTVPSERWADRVGSSYSSSAELTGFSLALETAGRERPARASPPGKLGRSSDSPLLQEEPGPPAALVADLLRADIPQRLLVRPGDQPAGRVRGRPRRPRLHLSEGSSGGRDRQPRAEPDQPRSRPALRPRLLAGRGCPGPWLHGRSRKQRRSLRLRGPSAAPRHGRIYASQPSERRGTATGRVRGRGARARL